MARPPGNPTIEIARLGPRDATALSALLTAAVDREPESFVTSPGDPDFAPHALGARLADPDEHVFVAHAGPWIGTATLTRERRAKRRHKYERRGFARLFTEKGALKLDEGYVDAHHMALRLGP